MIIYWMWQEKNNAKQGQWVIMLGKSISTGAQYVTPDSKIYCEKGAGLAQKIGFPAPNSSSLPRGCW